ncbi:uncharacterized protein LOC111013495 [Momordica charantia]|uniref:Uncharacterized protein LOC111013495 n=1 Tax=Momordica charantia TaxID=3673 RepID=A0A6J1CPW6_MOMCH|nr:uncharacterized protein LOC111013495 [Momordica charantia]
MALLVTPCFLPSYNSLCPKPIQFNFQINFKSMPMGLDFELKISPSSSFSNFELQLARGTPSPFWSNETNSMFILTAKLTGFSREDIGITINGTGTRIEIGWGQPVQRMEITRWMYKKETETRRFKKIFRIPDGVVLDEIKATYNDEESILKIVMPKLVDGILGVGIEEVKEQDVGEDALESQDSEAEEIPEVTEGFETGRETKFVEDAANGVFEGANATPEPSPKREYLAETTQEETEKLKGDEMEHIDGVSNHYSESEKSEKLTTEIAEAPKRWDNGGIVDSEIIIPKVRSVKGIELDEGTSKGTANHQKEKGEPNSEAHNGSIATMTNKQPDIKIQSQAAVDRDTKVPDKPELSQPNGKIQAEHKIVEQQGNKETYRSAWESKEFETNNEPEYIASPYLQSPEHEHEEKGVNQQGKSFQTQDEIKEAREESGSPQREKHEQSTKEAKQEKIQDSKQFKMRTPIIIAGSALLASLAIVVFNFVRSKKREKNMRG